MKIGVFITFIISIIVILIININAENTGGTSEIRETEKTKVRMASSLSMGSDVNNIVNKTVFEEYLSKYAGDITVTESSSESLTVTFNSTGNQYQVNVNTGIISETGEGFIGVESYIPTGFSEVSPATETAGLTIQDSTGNQYVWVEVPRTAEVYPTAGLNITEFTSEEYTKIENDLYTYTSVYRGDEWTDTWISEDAQGLTETAYNTLKQKMLKSVYQNGGFYVGKYETGTATARTSASDALTTAVIKQNMYPYNWVICSQAQTLASGMESGEYTTSLMFGVQWDLILKYFEVNGASIYELNENSLDWGNQKESNYNITNPNAKYYDNSWLSAPYIKSSGTSTLLTTGADETFQKMGIYNISGNVAEWTLGSGVNSYVPCALRGSTFMSLYPSSNWSSMVAGNTMAAYGFRVVLY